MSPRWSDDMNIRFVQLYKERQCLWDIHHELYKNKNARETALSEMVSEMNIDGFGVAEAKAKLKSLRSTYNIEMNKHEKSIKSGCGKEDIYIPSLKWFSIMKGPMAKRILKRQTTSTLVLDSCKITSENTERIDEDSLQGTSATNLPQDAATILPTRKEIKDEGNEVVRVNECSLLTSTDYHPKKKFKLCSKIQQIASTARELKLLSESISRSPTDENEFDIYGKHVAAQLKSLSPRLALIAEMEINNILSKCRFADLDATSTISPLSVSTLDSSSVASGTAPTITKNITM